ncbi:MAG: hypothetical protein WCA20_11155 [Candidatus Sulfotelmatobacter sp.]
MSEVPRLLDLYALPDEEYWKLVLDGQEKPCGIGGDGARDGASPQLQSSQPKTTGMAGDLGSLTTAQLARPFLSFARALTPYRIAHQRMEPPLSALLNGRSR